MDVRFWGVRGSIAVSGDRYQATGGNTTCVEVRAEGHRLILDGGTGLRALGAELGFAPINATLLFTHVHWDHIQGVPFFTPAFHPGARLTFAGRARDSGTLRDALDRQMRPPQFPITLDALAARVDWTDVRPGQAFHDGPFTITPIEVDHPDGVLAYRVEASGKSMVFATDVEHGGALNPELLRLAEGCDLLVHDAQYTLEEYEGVGGPPRRGWGHSCWEEAVAVAKEAGARALALFHHDPERDDDAVDALEAVARQRFSPCFAAREGATVVL